MKRLVYIFIIFFSLVPFCFSAQETISNSTATPGYDWDDARTHINSNFDEIYTFIATIDTEAEIKALYNLEIGTDVQAYDADLTTYAGITPSANVQSLLGLADYAAIAGVLDDVAWTFGAVAVDLSSATVTLPTISSTDWVDSPDYAAGSIDLEHMSANSVDSDQYVDGSIDLVHMSANSVDSDQYVDGSIDAVHIADWHAYDPIPIAWMNGGTSEPDALDTDTRPPYAYRTFAGDATEDLDFIWEVPADLSGTTIQYRVKYLITNATGPSSEGVVFTLAGASVGDNDITNPTLGTAVAIADTGITASQHDILVTDWSGDVTITDLLAGETAEMNITRDHDHASDTYVQLVGAIWVQIRYVQNVAR